MTAQVISTLIVRQYEPAWLLTGFQGYLTADAYIAYERIGELWPSIINRKAWLFFGNQSAGVTAAKLFTLTKTCNRLRIDPFVYLQDVYVRLPKMSLDELPQLLPDQWIKDHPQHLIQQRIQEALDRAQRARERRADRRRAA